MTYLKYQSHGAKYSKPNSMAIFANSSSPLSTEFFGSARFENYA